MAERLELPLFPLNTVLFPGGRLPLKVFEQRYVEMTKRCVRDGTPFGVCMIREGKEVGEPAVPAEIGCTAMIEEWDLPHPNLFELLARGERRFRILKSEVAELGLLVCEAEYLETEPSSEAPDALCHKVMSELVDRIGAEKFPGPVELDNAEWIAWRLGEILPLSAELRQQLLETDSPPGRLSKLRDILVAAGIEQSS